VIQLPEYPRRRLELEERRRGLASRDQLFPTQAERAKELGGRANSLDNVCQRVRAGFLQATFAQKRQLVELLIDRVIVPDAQGEIR
jgi:site-specific DNA recombinase